MYQHKQIFSHVILSVKSNQQKLGIIGINIKFDIIPCYNYTKIMLSLLTITIFYPFFCNFATVGVDRAGNEY